MSVLTRFDSEVPVERKSQGTYREVLFALGHDVRIAEAAFARIAKVHLRQLLTVPTKMVEGHGYGADPVWVVQHTVTIDSAHIPDNPVAENREDRSHGEDLLSSLVGAIANIINATADSHSAETTKLLGPLSVKVDQVGASTHRFQLKQRWSCEIRS